MSRFSFPFFWPGHEECASSKVIYIFVDTYLLKTKKTETLNNYSYAIGTRDSPLASAASISSCLRINSFPFEVPLLKNE